MNVAAAAMLMLAACGDIHAPAAMAQASEKSGAWFIKELPDRFGDGGTKIALAISDSPSAMGFGVRCIRKEGSLILMAVSEEDNFAAGKPHRLKFKIDRNEVVSGAGLAITPKMLQVTGEVELVPQLLRGKTLAVRLDRPNGTQMDYGFAINGAERALAPILKDCPDLIKE